LTITKPTTPAGSTSARAAIGTEIDYWLDISLTGDAEGTAEMHESMIKVKYDKAKVTAKGAVEENLRLAYYDGTNWVLPPSGGSVDMTAMVVVQSTSHFSQWGVYATGKNSASALSASLITVVAAVVAAVFGSRV